MLLMIVPPREYKPLVYKKKTLIRKLFFKTFPHYILNNLISLYTNIDYNNSNSNFMFLFSISLSFPHLGHLHWKTSELYMR